MKLDLSVEAIAELDRLTGTGLYGRTAAETAQIILLQKLREIIAGENQPK